MARAIVTFGRGWNALAIVRSLGRRGVEVFCGEESSFAPCFFSRYCTGHFQYPSPTNEPRAFVDYMAAKVQELAPPPGEPYVLMPVHKETFLLAEHRERFEPYIRLPVPSIENVRLTDDKGRLARLAEERGIRTPRTWQFHDINELYRCVPDLPLPLFVKVRDAAAGVGLRKVDTPEQLVTTFREFVDGFRLSPDQYPLVQEFVPGADHCVTALFDRGRCVAQMTYHNVRSFPRGKGIGALRETVACPQAEEMVVRLLSPLDWHGMVEVDFRVPDSGLPYLIEVNPRFFGGLPQCIAANLDYPYLLYQIATGQPPDPPPAIDYTRRTETPIVGLLSTLEEIAHDEVKLGQLRAVAVQWRRIPAAAQKREQFQRFLEQLKAVAAPANIKEYLHEMFAKHLGTSSDVFQADDPWPLLGLLYPVTLMLKHGKLTGAMLVSERELPQPRPRKRLRDCLRPSWATLLLAGALFLLAAPLENYLAQYPDLGWLLGWPRQAEAAVRQVHSVHGAPLGAALHRVLDFVYLYTAAGIILWLVGRRKK